MNKKKKVLAVILSMSIFVCNLKQTSAIETEFNKNISIKNINESFKVDENLEINANAFVRFFVVKYSTKSFISFADNVKKGSFVSFDRTDDGEFDHNGFVTHTIRKKGESRRKVKYLDTNLTYKDFKLAQHSNRYNEWTSVGKKNHWETLKQRFPKIKFVIVN